MQIHIRIVFIVLDICFDFLYHTFHRTQSHKLFQLILCRQNLLFCAFTACGKIDMVFLDVIVYVHELQDFIRSSCTAYILTHNDLLNNIPHLTGICKVWFFSDIICDVQHSVLCRIACSIFPGFQHQCSDLPQFVPIIIGKIQCKLNSGLKSRIGCKHLVHLIFISCKNYAEFAPIIFHCLYQR